MTSMLLTARKQKNDLFFRSPIDREKQRERETTTIMTNKKHQNNTNTNTTRAVNCKRDSYDVYIGRGSKWGNPYSHLENSKAKHKVKTRCDAIYMYRQWITTGEGIHLLDDLHELKGKRLGCFCKPKSCHGDVLAEMVEQKFSDTNLDFMMTS